MVLTVVLTVLTRARAGGVHGSGLPMMREGGSGGSGGGLHQTRTR